MREPSTPVLDTTGRRCPVPVLMTARVLTGLAAGARLRVVGDDPEMAVDIPAWCERSGNRCLAVTQEGGLVVCEVERAALPILD
jgi:tRNA 2-thiouridine synthesizing protein A